MFTLESFVQNEHADNGAVFVTNGIDPRGSHWDPGLLRPYIDDRGRIWVDVFKGVAQRRDGAGKPVFNAEGQPVLMEVREPQLVTDRIRQGLPVLNVNNASVLRKDQWIMLDQTVLTAARARMRAWADLRGASTFGGFDGMATPILEHEIMTDPGQAQVDMEGLAEGQNLAPKFVLQGLPLPITHADFWLSERFLAVSRNRGTPQDTIRAEIAGRRVGELIEQTAIGTVEGLAYGSDAANYATSTSKVYGYVNHPDRITKTDITASATIETNIATTGGTTFVREVIEMLQLAYANNFYGPFMLYVSTNYDALLDNDFKAESDLTIRQRVRQIDGINDVRRLDYLTGDVLLLVQMTGDVVQAVNGLDVVTVQWDTMGGMRKNFKVMAIQVPRIRSVYKSGTTTRVTGIVHGTTS